MTATRSRWLRHVHVGYHQADIFAGEQLQCAGRVGCRKRRKTGCAQRVEQRLAQRRIVLDHQNRIVHFAHGLSSAGSSITNVAPQVESAKQTLPPCASTTDLTIDRPMPLPRARVVKKGSKMRSRMGAGTPGPLSLTTICARPVAVRRASNSKLSGPVAACRALVARFNTADTNDGALARTINSFAWVRIVKRTPSRSAGRSHCATCSSRALTLTASRAAPP